MMRSALILTAALALVACSKEPEAPAKPAEVLPMTKAKVDKVVPFTCEGDMAVTAFYGLDALGNPDLALIIRGDDYRLLPTDADKGKRYASPQGAAPNVGIIWWEMEDGTALLQQAPSDQVNDPAAGKTARTCKIKSEPDKPKIQPKPAAATQTQP